MCLSNKHVKVFFNVYRTVGPAIGYQDVIWYAADRSKRYFTSPSAPRKTRAYKKILLTSAQKYMCEMVFKIT